MDCFFRFITSNGESPWTHNSYHYVRVRILIPSELRLSIIPKIHAICHDNIQGLKFEATLFSFCPIRLSKYSIAISSVKLWIGRWKEEGSNCFFTECICIALLKTEH